MASSSFIVARARLVAQKKATPTLEQTDSMLFELSTIVDEVVDGHRVSDVIDELLDYRRQYELDVEGRKLSWPPTT